MLPLVLCNAMCLNFVILSQTASGYDICKVIGGSSDNLNVYLLLHEYKDHYNGIIINPMTNTFNVNIIGQTLDSCPSPTHDIDPTLVACQPTNVSSNFISASGGGTLNCDAIDTSGTTCSSDHKCYDANQGCDMNDPVSDSPCISVSDRRVMDYMYHLKRYRTNNPENCIIGHLNINSIQNKFEAVECVLNNGLIYIFALSESKIDVSFPNAAYCKWLFLA